MATQEKDFDSTIDSAGEENTLNDKITTSVNLNTVYKRAASNLAKANQKSLTPEQRAKLKEDNIELFQFVYATRKYLRSLFGHSDEHSINLSAFGINPEKAAKASVSPAEQQQINTELNKLSKARSFATHALSATAFFILGLFASNALFDHGISPYKQGTNIAQKDGSNTSTLETDQDLVTSKIETAPQPEAPVVKAKIPAVRFIALYVNDKEGKKVELQRTNIIEPYITSASDDPEWLILKHSRGFPVWVHNSMLTIKDKVATIRKNNVNARSRPSTDTSVIIGQFNKNDEAQVLKSTKEWSFVRSPEKFNILAKESEYQEKIEIDDARAKWLEQEQEDADAEQAKTTKIEPVEKSM